MLVLLMSANLCVESDQTNDTTNDYKFQFWFNACLDKTLMKCVNMC